MNVLIDDIMLHPSQIMVFPPTVIVGRNDVKDTRTMTSLTEWTHLNKLFIRTLHL